MTAKIFIDGEHGTTGLQIRSRLEGRKDIEIISVPVERRKNKDARAEYLDKADIAILCLPDDAARESVSLIPNDTTRVIDASTAHRVADGWTYGFAEMDEAQAKAIAAARFVANPGCWPQGPIAMLRPLLKAGLLPKDYPVTINGVTGYSGGGRQMMEDYEAKGDAAPRYLPYGLTLNHKHLPEIKTYTGLDNDVIMQPVIGNFAQGMLTAIPLQLGQLDHAPTGKDIHAALEAHYGKMENSVVEVAPLEELERSPALDPQSLNDTNNMRIHVFANDARKQAVLIAVYDNLGKGASGAAVQNMDLMLGRVG